MKGWLPEIGLVVALLVAASVAYLDRNPIHQAVDLVEAPAPRPTDRGVKADVALIASASGVAGRQTGPIEQRDHAFAWVSFLEQEFGPWRLVDPAALASGALAGVRIAIVPRLTWNDLQTADRDALTAFVEAGGTLVTERPPTGAVPASDRVLQVEPPLALRLASIQQGRWRSDAPPVPSDFPGVDPGLIQPHALKDPDVPNTAWEPVADQLERSLTERIVAAAPVGRWWLFPDGVPAYVALTHDEEGFGDKSAWMPAEQGRRGVESTTFVMDHAITEAGVRALRTARSHVHLHWNRGFAGMRSAVRSGWPVFEPYIRDRTLQEQAARLDALGAPKRLLALNRNHGLVWDPAPGRTFRALQAAGMAVDSSYGPAGPGRFGYLFGTGLPFRPLDDTGWPFALLEIPFAYQDDEQFSRADQKRLIEEAAKKHHQLVTPIFHVNTMARVPSAETMEGWLEVVGLSRKAGALVGSLDAFVEVWRGRLVSPLQSRWADSVLTVEFDAASPHLAVAIPARLPSGEPRELRIDGDVVDLATMKTYGGQVVVPVPSGKHSLTVRFP